MRRLILDLDILFENDVVSVRQRARQISALLGFDTMDQTRIATAASEMARNAFKYAGKGKVDFLVDYGENQPTPIFVVRISDQGPGIRDLDAILSGRPQRGMGILSARRLMDQFQIDSVPGRGTTVLIGRKFPRGATVTERDLARLSKDLAQRAPQDPFEEIRQQNFELARALEELRARQEELIRLNKELEDTNRGIVALYAELDEKAGHLRRADELKSRFLSNMSHEFRTPVNSIIALCRLMLEQEDGTLSAEQVKQVTFIRKNAQDLLDLVNDLLDLAKVEAGRITIQPTHMDVGNLFGALRGMFRPLLTNSSTNLIFDEPSGIPPMFTDEGKVSQILRNFISNALKYTERGEVRVSATFDPERRVVVFAVADTGIGIAPEDQDRIFLEFTQVDHPIQKRVKGTGLGLPLARKLAELLGGKIHVKSVVGSGSTFFAEIPVTYEAAAPEPLPHVTTDYTRIPLLVVEDKPETLLLYEKYLKGTGFQFIPARSVAEARKTMERVRPVAIVLDVLLSGNEAWDFLVETKRSPLTQDIPIYVVSILEEIGKGMALGADDYCVKPMERNWLLNKLRTLARSRPVEKVLIVDDDDVARYLLKGLLGDTRYKILEAGGGVHGLKLAREEKPQVIFLDLIMPEMTGFEVLRELRADPATRDIPVIVLTAKQLEEQERRQLATQVVSVLSKETTSREEAITRLREALVGAQAELARQNRRNSASR